MTFYVDASAIVAVVASEPTSALVDKLIRETSSTTFVSDFAMVECSAALAKNSRVKGRTMHEADNVYVELDAWSLVMAEQVDITSRDVADATTFVRRSGLALRAPDAIHIAAARRLGATLLTLDRGMARAATILGVSCINPADDQAA